MQIRYLFSFYLLVMFILVYIWIDVNPLPYLHAMIQSLQSFYRPLKDKIPHIYVCM